MNQNRLLQLAGVPLTEGKLTEALDEREKALAAALRTFFVATLKYRMSDEDIGVDVLAAFQDEWGDLPHAVDAVVRSVLKTEKDSVKKELKGAAK